MTDARELAFEVDVDRSGQVSGEIRGPPLGLIEPPPHVEQTHGALRGERRTQAGSIDEDVLGFLASLQEGDDTD